MQVLIKISFIFALLVALPVSVGFRPLSGRWRSPCFSGVIDVMDIDEILSQIALIEISAGCAHNGRVDLIDGMLL